MAHIDRREVIMPGGVEMTLQAEQLVAFRPDAHWLSVAYGTGDLELYLAEQHGCSISGVDTGAWAVERAREKAAARGLDGLVSFEGGDARALRFGAETFDGVFCSGALCAFLERGLGEFHRVLKPGGRHTMTIEGMRRIGKKREPTMWQTRNTSAWECLF